MRGDDDSLSFLIIYCFYLNFFNVYNIFYLFRLDLLIFFFKYKAQRIIKKQYFNAV